MKWIYDHLLYVLVGGISLFTLVSHSSAFYAPSISLFVFLVSTLVLVCVPFLKLNRRDFHWPVLVVVGFWAWSLISGFFGNEFGLSMVGFFGRGTSVFFSLICMLAFLLVAQSGFLLARKVLVLLPLLGGIMGLLGVGEWLGVLQFSPDPSRLYGIPRNPIFLANMLTVTLAFTLYYYFSRKITHKAWLLVSAFLQVFTLFFTLTRGTLIGLAIALAVWFVVYMHRKLKFGIATRSWVIPVAAVLLLLVVGYAARGTTIHRLTTVSDTSAQTRLITWISSLPGFLENPVLGVGPENFYVISAKYFDPRQYQYSESGFFDKPHNQFLQVLVEQGGVGFVLYVLIVFSVYRMLFLARKRERLTSNQFWSLAACVAAYYSTLFFAFESPQALILFFLLIGFLYILAFADVNEQAKFKLSTSTIVTAVCAAVLWYFVPLHGISLARSAGLALSASPQSHISGDAAEKFLRNLRVWPAAEVAQDYHTYAFGYLEALTEQVKNNPDVIRNVRISQSLLREAHIQEPNNFLVLNKLALNLINSGVFLAEDHVVEIKELIRQLQQVAPNRAETHRIVAVNAFVLKDYVTARVSMETSLKLEPNNPRNLWLAAQINKAASFEPEAFAYAMKAFRLGYTPRSLSSMTWVIQDSSKYGTKEENDLVAKVANQIAN